MPEVYDEADIVFVAGAMLLPSFEGEDLAAFMKKAREGLEVRVIYDGVGSVSLKE